ncbi:MAG TPA: FAD-dependent oxidoreductase [Mycobacteriales bacterium]|nr:FAD-dependent oxidoreductase [Mycobacteriales bacterium]
MPAASLPESALPESTTSYWIASTSGPGFPEAPAELDADVVVIGGGIAGLTTARQLQLAGRSVVVVEAGRILEGVTGNTTAKVSTQHGLVYADLVSSHGESKARLYADAQGAALEHIAGSGIDCDFARVDSFVYSLDSSELEKLQGEAEAAVSLGLPASYTTEVPLPYDVAGAVRFAGQGQFHPRKYLLALAAQITDSGGVILEGTRALDVDDDDPCVITTDRGVIRARDVVVATHIPFLDRGLYFARQFPVRDYVVAAPIAASSAPDGIFLSTESPTHSVRTTPYDGGLLLIVAGEGHTPGREEDTDARYDALGAWAREKFGVSEIAYRWSTQDYTSEDRVPFIGPLTKASQHIWTATAFGAWGMTNGTVAGLLLSDLITGRDNPWAEVFDPGRGGAWLQRTKKLVTENLSVGKALVSGYLTGGDVSSVDELAPGEGAVLRFGPAKTACYRDDSGKVHAVSAKCTHLGCIVAFNSAEKSWDCPCHGSRFDVDGAVLQGPAVDPLSPASVPD